MKAEYKVLRNNIRNNLWNGIAWSIGFNCVTPFIAVLAARLGATNNDYALLSSIPALLTILLVIPASIIIGRFRKQKRIIATIIIICRLFYFLLIFVPYMGVSAITSLILLVGLYSATNSVIAVAWQSMMGEIIPASYRNRVFAQRNMWTGLCGCVVAFIAGWGIDSLPYPFGYQVAFSVGFLFAIIETWYFMKLRIPSEEIIDHNQIMQQIGPVKESHSSTSWIERYKLNQGRAYYLFCGSAIVYIFAWQAAWPIYAKIKADTLLATNTMISIDVIAGALGALLGFRLFARVADRRGTAWTVFISALMLGLTPYLWLHAPNMNWVYLYDFIGGIATAGFQQSAFNRLLEIVPEQGRQRGIAIYTTLSQISAIFAPILGMKLFSSVAYETSMTLIGSFRVIGSLCFLLIVTPSMLRWASAKQSNQGSN
ncbi:MFS-type transporter involved in bile tolerance, Atg22 family [Paenibacillus sp. 1_12]|uniref:MFS transporter n=1 Tax=Paenibacillus sp. 1_12 TaxID=1566278 RepID=UPI0008ECD724|nr:MFS transporter [Paenibacillus sp. 1_12]SFL23602.1 MFS-type transporter involved in bile tolerance, Atg22 family [Paenibacillus sp. 1_12]